MGSKANEIQIWTTGGFLYFTTLAFDANWRYLPFVSELLLSPESVAMQQDDFRVGEVFVGPGTVFTNDLFPNAEEANRGQWAMVETHVGDGVAIGANCTILCGFTIGKGALIGAGSVVTKDVPPYAIVAGNPARVKGHRKPKEVGAR